MGRYTSRLIAIVAVAAGDLFASGEMSLARAQNAPAGYEWQACKITGRGLLRPKGWEFEEWEGHTCGLLHIDSGDDVRPKPTLMIIVNKDLPKDVGPLPSGWARRYVELKAKGKVVVKRWDGSRGSLVSVGVEVRHGSPERHEYFWVLANDRTGILFTIVAESSEKAWPETWKVLEPTLTQLAVDEDK